VTATAIRRHAWRSQAAAGWWSESDLLSQMNSSATLARRPIAVSLSVTSSQFVVEVAVETSRKKVASIATAAPVLLLVPSEARSQSSAEEHSMMRLCPFFSFFYYTQRVIDLNKQTHYQISNKPTASFVLGCSIVVRHRRVDPLNKRIIVQTSRSDKLQA
jgi:hypothetical protein